MEEKALEVKGSPSELITLALNKGSDLEKLEKLLALKERFELNEARKAYHKSMSVFKANPPKIDKDKAVAYGNTKYNHASLGNVTEKISEALSKCGLSASWATKQETDKICVTCRITHELGHSEETTLCAASDTSGSKNAIQAIGSTITYLERYTLLALTGLATYDQDDDGQAAGKPVEFITPEQVTEIGERVTKIGKAFKLAKFLKFLNVETTAGIKKDDYKKAISVLEQAEKEKAKK